MLTLQHAYISMTRGHAIMYQIVEEVVDEIEYLRGMWGCLRLGQKGVALFKRGVPLFKRVWL